MHVLHPPMPVGSCCRMQQFALLQQIGVKPRRELSQARSLLQLHAHSNCTLLTKLHGMMVLLMFDSSAGLRTGLETWSTWHAYAILRVREIGSACLLLQFLPGNAQIETGVGLLVHPGVKSRSHIVGVCRRNAAGMPGQGL